MIHFRPEGTSLRLGLNLTRTRGGFVAIWAWYDFPTSTGIVYRLRLRMHIKPNILWSVDRFNVVDEHLALYGLELIPREKLGDLRALPETQKRVNEPLAYIKPQ